MKRLLLPTLLGVFCLALLALPAAAGQYDPRNPPPTPYINIDDTENSEIGWDGTAQSYVIDQNLDLPTVAPSEGADTFNSNAANGDGQLQSVMKKVILTVFVPIVLGL